MSIVEHSVYDLPPELQDQMNSIKSRLKDDDEYSEVEMKTAYILSTSILKQNARRNKLA